MITSMHGPLARYVKLRVAHAPGMPGTFSPPPRISDPDMHHGTCVTHVPWCMPGSLTSNFLWSRRRGKRMRNPQFYVSGKRPMDKHYASLPLCVGQPLDPQYRVRSNAQLWWFLCWFYEIHPKGTMRSIISLGGGNNRDARGLNQAMTTTVVVLDVKAFDRLVDFSSVWKSLHSLFSVANITTKTKYIAVSGVFISKWSGGILI